MIQSRRSHRMPVRQAPLGPLDDYSTGLELLSKLQNHA